MFTMKEINTLLQYLDPRSYVQCQKKICSDHFYHPEYSTITHNVVFLPQKIRHFIVLSVLCNLSVIF